MAIRAKKFLEDYELRESVTETGKVKRKYVYVGDWYERQAPDGRKTVERYVYVALSMVAAFLLVLAMVQQVKLNRGGFFAAISILALIPAFFTFEGSVEALFKNRKLTKSEYRERFFRLKLMPLTEAVMELVLVAGYVAYGIAEKERAYVLPCVSVFAAVLLNAAIGVNELLVKYHVIEAEPRPLKDDGQQGDVLKKYYD